MIHEMPDGMSGVSDAAIRRYICRYIVDVLQASRVFDLGMGVGIYGVRLRTTNPEITMVGLDGWLPYLMTEWAQAYAARIHAPLEAVLNGAIPVWGDVVICMDVVEHLERPTAERLLGFLEEIPIPTVMSTPLFQYTQGAANGNPLEEHRCFFTEDELTARGWSVVYKSVCESPLGEAGDIAAFSTS